MYLGTERRCHKNVLKLTTNCSPSNTKRKSWWLMRMVQGDKYRQHTGKVADGGGSSHQTAHRCPDM